VRVPFEQRTIQYTKEYARLQQETGSVPPWRRWGPYVAERSWSTVREDYSEWGTAWESLPHEKARSKAYRWGEDGLAGICDRYQLLVFSLALWNERDPILKERAFGLTNSEGNHGEDVKEYYFYLDNLPTHSYMKYLYKYPQAEFPYRELVEENARRHGGLEYELIDTGVFDDDRYFDVFVEYAKQGPEDIFIRIEAFNRGPDEAPLHILPHFWFRNTWAWTAPPNPEPIIRPGPRGKGYVSLIADDAGYSPLHKLPFEYQFGPHYLYADPDGELLFTNNETNGPVVYGPWSVSRKPFVKDAFHRHIIHGEPCVNPAQEGTKSCVHYQRVVPAGGTAVIRLRLRSEPTTDPFRGFDRLFQERRSEADEFYASLSQPLATAEERLIQRQALAGMLWCKQIYLFDVDLWLDGDNPRCPPPACRQRMRNIHWRHLNSMRVMTMPDKWEYPWFAAWDLAFHCVPLTLVDPEFAKEQLWLLLFEQFQHPSGQIPAYEWEFSDMNPPVHAWAVWRVYNMQRLQWGIADRSWLEACFHKLLINFGWWVNKVDSQGYNIFEGGFLGLDNITVIDRSSKLPGDVVLEQSDGTGWMGMFCLTMMRIALELAKENRIYEGLASKFFQHYVYIGAAMKHMGGQDYSLWDERDGFFYDVLRYPDHSFHKFRVRSLVGLIPLYAVERLEMDWIEPFERFRANVEWFVKHRQDLVHRCCHLIERDGKQIYVLTIVDQNQFRRVLEKLLDPNEFFSEWGIRSLSRHHEAHPFRFGEREVGYEPAEAHSKIMGGNSNWRGPVWFPTSFLMVESLRRLGRAYGDTFKVVMPGGDGEEVELTQVAGQIADRMIALFRRGDDGRRPVFGWAKKFQDDPHWRDHLLFYEYFHGDNGAGLGASHQTGWTGLVATLLDEWRH
jgi:mannosylglycerate hydrolase MGH1-like protein